MIASNRDVLKVDGLHVEHLRADGKGDARPPLVFTHGGSHGSWCWTHFMPYFATRGWDCWAFSWRNHPGSDDLPEDVFIRRGIVDVVEDLARVVKHVVEQVGRLPILVGHSMGGLISQKYAENHPVRGLALIAPGAPTQVGRGRTFDVGIEMSKPWGPPPREIAIEIFGWNEAMADLYYDKLVPESPQCIKEVTRGWLVSVDNVRISSPVLVMGAELDKLGAPDLIHDVAVYYGAEYRFYFGRGHDLITDPRWEETANDIESFLERNFPVPAGGRVRSAT